MTEHPLAGRAAIHGRTRERAWRRGPRSLWWL